MNYRIKIEEKNNGEKGYIPQVGRSTIVPKLFKKVNVVLWENIIPNSIGSPNYKGDFDSSNTLTVIYDTEEKALTAIEMYKNRQIIEKGNRVKTVSYLMVD